MTKIDELLNEWEIDSKIDAIHPDDELLKIPRLHSKYLQILSKNKLLLKEYEIKQSKMCLLRFEYYQGTISIDNLKKYNWNPFPMILIKSEISKYLDADDELIKIIVNKKVIEELIYICESILKELSARTFQLRDVISYRKFISGM